MIRARVGFTRRSDGDVQTRGYAVHGGMDGNPHFPKPPVRMSDLKAALIDFDYAIGGAADGGRKAFAEKKKCREVVITMLRQLGHYVEVACNDNMAIFLSSGFEAVSAPGATEQCPTPTILKIRQGKSGELLVFITPLYRQIVQYELRYGPQAADGAPPDEWTVHILIQENSFMTQRIVTRRELLKAGAAVAATTVPPAVLPGWFRELLSGPQTCARLTDIQKVVIFIQENRSFDHYFGSYRGVRGF